VLEPASPCRLPRPASPETGRGSHSGLPQPQPHARPLAALLDEDDAGGFERLTRASENPRIKRTLPGLEGGDSIGPALAFRRPCAIHDLAFVALCGDSSSPSKRDAGNRVVISPSVRTKSLP
jgi:hypothetical protein